MSVQEEEQLDAIARLHEEKLELEHGGYLLNKPGDTEAEALTTVACHAFLFGLLGTALAGAALGTLMFPLLGTIAGFLMACIGGIVPCLLAALLYATSRGRISSKFAMAWAGAATGVGCFANAGPIPFMWVICTISGLFGAVGARLATRRAVRSYHFEEGLGKRTLRQFAIVDLMLLTVWLAVCLTVVRIFARVMEWTGTTILTSLAISLVCAWIVEMIVQLYRAGQSSNAK